jgi:hypothetical protein
MFIFASPVIIWKFVSTVTYACTRAHTHIKVEVLVTMKTSDVVRDHMQWHQFGSHYFTSRKTKKTPAAGCAVNVAAGPSGSI